MDKTVDYDLLEKKKNTSIKKREIKTFRLLGLAVKVSAKLLVVNILLVDTSGLRRRVTHPYKLALYQFY